MEENVSQPDREDLIYYASKVILLSDGLMVIATLPEEVFNEFMQNKEQTIKAIPDTNGVTLIVGSMAIPLPGEVFSHTVQTGNIYIYLSGFNDYLMCPWVMGKVEPAELWSVKGVSEYLAKSSSKNLNALN